MRALALFMACYYDTPATQLQMWRNHFCAPLNESKIHEMECTVIPLGPGVN